MVSRWKHGAGPIKLLGPTFHRCGPRFPSGGAHYLFARWLGFRWCKEPSLWSSKYKSFCCISWLIMLSCHRADNYRIYIFFLGKYAEYYLNVNYSAVDIRHIDYQHMVLVY